MAGKVFVGTNRVHKAGERFEPDTILRVSESAPYVSRGGEKLKAAIDAFTPLGLTIQNKRCIDVGASTGGFTDCLLQHGAHHVVAVDVGYGQLHPKLRKDPRVTVRERTNARHLTRDDFAAPFDLVVVDASFISLAKLAHALAQMAAATGELIALVKPQFEAGRDAVSRGKGVIRDDDVRRDAIAKAVQSLIEHGFEPVGDVPCPVHGPKGNVEQLVYARCING